VDNITIKRGDFGKLKQLVESGTIPHDRVPGLEERLKTEDVVLEQLTGLGSYVKLENAE